MVPSSSRLFASSPPCLEEVPLLSSKLLDSDKSSSNSSTTDTCARRPDVSAAPRCVNAASNLPNLYEASPRRVWSRERSSRADAVSSSAASTRPFFQHLAASSTCPLAQASSPALYAFSASLLCVEMASFSLASLTSLSLDSICGLLGSNPLAVVRSCVVR